MVNGALPGAGSLLYACLRLAARSEGWRRAGAAIPFEPMARKSSVRTSASAVAMGFAEAAPLRLPTGEAQVAGDAASPDALARLEGAISELRALTVAPLLREALERLRVDDAKGGADWALKALNLDERSGMAWYVLAVARDKAGDFDSSLRAYEAALALLPDETEIANDLGRLAYRMGMSEVAEQLFRSYLAAHPESFEAANNLACVVRDLGRCDEAIEILKPAIRANPGDAMMWNTLGTIVERSDVAGSIVFFDEALRLDPSFAKARYNRANARLAMDELGAAQTDCLAAIADSTSDEDRAMMGLALSNIRLCQGRLDEGWAEYESRLSPSFAGGTFFIVERPRWTPQDDLEGRTLLMMGEQGLGDEVLFANMIPDVLEALGDRGQLALALEPRLVSLFRRSFPSANVGAHATFKAQGHILRGAPFLGAAEGIDLWAPMASLLRRFRRSLDAFPSRKRFLAPDPARVDFWRGVLAAAPAGPKVGILWKSMNLSGSRSRYFSPFGAWAPVLRTRGISFVNMQYGDCAAELEMARRELGLEIWTPPGIDLKNDLDDVAALSCALDLTVGFANATSNIAAACGAPTWIISAPGAWTRLGTERMPWYPQVRVFLPPAFNEWDPAMAQVAEALAAFA
jgi:tetratricopeptide (TPR) repeat protein